MAGTNFTIASPDFDRIKAGNRVALVDAIRLLWFVLNEEAATRRVGVRQAAERSIRKTLTDAPTSNQNNYPTAGAAIIYFTGSTSFNLTGLLSSGQTGERITLHNEGSGTITLKHASASSDPLNRLSTASGGDVSLTTGKTVILHYLGSLWREASLA